MDELIYIFITLPGTITALMLGALAVTVVVVAISAGGLMSLVQTSKAHGGAISFLLLAIGNFIFIGFVPFGFWFAMMCDCFYLAFFLANFIASQSKN